jgi:CheY-like chemotaxis protein
MKRSGSIYHDPRCGSVRPLSGRGPIPAGLSRSCVKWGLNTKGPRLFAGQADETRIEAGLDLMRSELSDNAWSEPVAQVRVLVADDDKGVRAHFVALLGNANGVASMLEAADGAEAVQVGLQLRPEIAVLDFNMPRLNGAEAAQTLTVLRPSMRIALQSSDPDRLRGRAAGLGLPLFDKLECERLVDWVEAQALSYGPGVDETVAAVSALRPDLTCSMCGYGIVSRRPPERCPMCHVEAAWMEPRSSPAHRAAAHGRSAG